MVKKAFFTAWSIGVVTSFQWVNSQPTLIYFIWIFFSGFSVIGLVLFSKHFPSSRIKFVSLDGAIALLSLLIICFSVVFMIGFTHITIKG